MWQRALKYLRLALILFGCGGIVLGATSLAAAQGARIWLDPATLDLTPDDVGTMDIRVENVAQLAGAEVHLTYDPTLLEVVDTDPSTQGAQITHGDFLSPDFVVQNVSDPDAGTIDYAIACMPLDKAVSGDGVLARITFRALAEGEGLVTIRSILLADVHGQPIAVETSSGVIVISRPRSSQAVWVLIVLVAVVVAAGSIVVVWSAIQARDWTQRKGGDER